MGIETGICYSTSKLSLFPFIYRGSVLEVLFGETEVNYEHLATDVPFANDEVWWLDIPVNEPSRMDIVYTIQHLD